MGTYYKVLVDGRSCHGGDMQWALPTQAGDGTWIPGEEMRVVGELSICNWGLHLTTNPDYWWKPGCRYYEAEVTGKAGETAADKTVVSACRLLREVPAPEYLRRAEALIDEIKGFEWFSQSGPVDPAWRLFTAPTLHAARGAARGAAYGAAYDAACDAARDAACGAARGAAYGAAYDAACDAGLYAVIAGFGAALPIDQKHRDHVEARIEVWRRGYGLLCDVAGALYVYGVNKEG